MDYLILMLATWRLSSLITHELGPFDIFERFRVVIGVREGEYGKYGTNQLSKGIACLWCVSVWVGLFWVVSYMLFDIWLALPFALSGGAILADEMISNDH